MEHKWRERLQHICMRLSKEETTEDATGVHRKITFKINLTKWLVTTLAVHNKLKVIDNVNLRYLSQ